ncbi:MAG: hypothetical protein BroJett038_24020 [Chloroflexota bacterium]|nr:MAG: hypothetical protein BroJett038_24020 [Chloroflexota bacterium]
MKVTGRCFREFPEFPILPFDPGQIHLVSKRLGFTEHPPHGGVGRPPDLPARPGNLEDMMDGADLQQTRHSR